MKKLINDVRDVVPEMLERHVLGNPEAVVLAGEAVAVRKTRTRDVSHRGWSCGRPARSQELHGRPIEFRLGGRAGARRGHIRGGNSRVGRCLSRHYSRAGRQGIAGSGSIRSQGPPQRLERPSRKWHGKPRKRRRQSA